MWVLSVYEASLCISLANFDHTAAPFYLSYYNLRLHTSMCTGPLNCEHDKNYLRVAFFFLFRNTFFTRVLSTEVFNLSFHGRIFFFSCVGGLRRVRFSDKDRNNFICGFAKDEIESMNMQAVERSV